MFKITPTSEGFRIFDKTEESETFYRSKLELFSVLFTDGTSIVIDTRTQTLSLIKKGPCFVFFDDGVLYYGKTHLQFIAGEMLTLGATE